MTGPLDGPYDGASTPPPPAPSVATAVLPATYGADLPQQRDVYADFVRIAALAGVLLILGIIGGVAWGLIIPGVTGVVVAPKRFAELTADTVHRFDAIAFYACVSAVVGLISALIAWSVRPLRGPVGVAVLAIVSMAGSGLGVWIGGLVSSMRHPGAGDTRPGGYFVSSVSLRLAGGDLGFLDLSWAIVAFTPTVALIVYLVVVLRSRDPSLGVELLTGAPESDPVTSGSSTEGPAQPS